MTEQTQAKKKIFTYYGEITEIKGRGIGSNEKPYVHFSIKNDAGKVSMISAFGKAAAAFGDLGMEVGKQIACRVAFDKASSQDGSREYSRKTAIAVYERAAHEEMVKGWKAKDAAAKAAAEGTAAGVVETAPAGEGTGEEVY